MSFIGPHGIPACFSVPSQVSADREDSAASIRSFSTARFSQRAALVSKRVVLQPGNAHHPAHARKDPVVAGPRRQCAPNFRNMPKAVIEGLSLLKSAQCTKVRRRNQHVPRKSVRRPPPCLTIGVTSGIAKLPSSGVRTSFFGDGSERCDRENGMHRPIAWIRFGALSRTRQWRSSVPRRRPRAAAHATTGLITSAEFPRRREEQLGPRCVEQSCSPAPDLDLRM